MKFKGFKTKLMPELTRCVGSPILYKYQVSKSVQQLELLNNACAESRLKKRAYC